MHQSRIKHFATSADFSHCGPEVLSETCVAITFVDDDDDDCGLCGRAAKFQQNPIILGRVGIASNQTMLFKGEWAEHHIWPERL